MKPWLARAILRIRSGVEVGATSCTTSSPAGPASARSGSASSGGTSATITPSTPASTAVRQKALSPNARIGL